MDADSFPKLRAAVLTPAGRGAIATVAVWGERALELVGHHFHPAAGKPLASFRAGRVVFGVFQSDSSAEELVVTILSPREIEIHCHGGPLAAQSIMNTLVTAGCEEVSWQTWCDDHEPSMIKREAREALASALTERTARILLDQYRGALETAIEEVLVMIERLDLQAAVSRLSNLEATFQLGRRLAEPWLIVIAGRPNVGKSSLINAILGYQRSIVLDEPGTTRDIVTAATAIDGWPVELADTAGLREAGDAIESEGNLRARAIIDRAHMVVFLADRSADWTVADEELFASIKQNRGDGPILVAHNKADLPEAAAADRPPGLAISARTGAGIAELLARLAQILVPSPPAPGSAVIFTERQKWLIEEARFTLPAGDFASALAAVNQLIGPGRIT